ncbi:MAG: VOC family protein [Chlorobi bacterium]|nr:VOC family protein [Chlorobiota bacterium]
MELGHIALSIKYPEDIIKFYGEILNMKFIRKFVINKESANEIFSENSAITVNVVRNAKLSFELFISNKPSKILYNHICITVKNREEIFHKALANRYKSIRIKRNSHDLLFVKDKSDNTFELQEQKVIN